MGRGKYESYKSGIRGEKEEPIVIPRPASRIADKLVVGEKYFIHAAVKGMLDNMGERKQDIRMKCVGLYPHLAVFERPAGYCESFTYWELERVMQG